MMNKSIRIKTLTECKHIPCPTSSDAKYWHQRTNQIGAAQGFDWTVAINLQDFNAPKPSRFDKIGLKCGK